MNIDQVKGLGQDRRDQAVTKARRSIERRIGPQPERAQFRNQGESTYPRSVRLAIYLLLSVPLASWFLLSAMRLFEIGAQNAGSSQLLGFISQDKVAGVAIVLGAEISQILFTVAYRVLIDNDRAGRLAFVSGMAIATAVALVGNIEYQLWGKHITAFLVLDTVSAPVVVLLLGEVLAKLWLDSARVNHQERVIYDRALAEWRDSVAHIEDHPDWSRAFATVLRHELAQVNGIGVDDLTADEWRVLVEAEMHAEDWWNSGGIPQKVQRRSVHKADGLIGSVDGDGTKAEKVAVLLKRHPHLLEMTRTGAIAEIGVGNSAFYDGLELYNSGRNGHGEA